MGVANTKSNIITDLDATPRVLINRRLSGGVLMAAVAKVEVAAGDDDTSVYRMVRVPSHARVHKIELLNDAIADGTDYDIGLYQTAANGGAVLDINCFADAVSMASARVAPLDVTHEGGGLDIADIEKQVFEVGGLTTDPGRDYDICLTGVTVGSAAGTIALRVEWVE